MIPSVETCFQMMDRYGMLEHIKEHSIMVAGVAALIADGLLKAGSNICLRTTVAGALMHDIGKTLCLGNGKDHAAEGGRICRRHAFDEIEPLVAEHVILRSFDPEGACTEREIVYYADKRVNHNRVVSLRERLGYLLETYGGGLEWRRRAIRNNFRQCVEVEHKLFRRLPFGPESVQERVFEGLPHRIPLDWGSGTRSDSGRAG